MPATQRLRTSPMRPFFSTASYAAFTASASSAFWEDTAMPCALGASSVPARNTSS